MSQCRSNVGHTSGAGYQHFGLSQVCPRSPIVMSMLPFDLSVKLSCETKNHCNPPNIQWMTSFMLMMPWWPWTCRDTRAQKSFWAAAPDIVVGEAKRGSFINWHGCRGTSTYIPNRRFVSSNLVSYRTCCIACTRCGLITPVCRRHGFQTKYYDPSLLFRVRTSGAFGRCRIVFATLWSSGKHSCLQSSLTKMFAGKGSILISKPVSRCDRPKRLALTLPKCMDWRWRSLNGMYTRSWTRSGILVRISVSSQK